MADHVLWMMLSLAHRGRELAEDQRLRRWEGEKYARGFVELNGSTMGILAFGDIGQAVARRAAGFDMVVYAADINPAPPPPQVKEVWGLDRLDELMELSDWFVVTAPLTRESKGMIDRRRVCLLKPTSYVIVISRGGIVDEDALADALSRAVPRAGYAGHGKRDDDVGHRPVNATVDLWRHRPVAGQTPVSEQPRCSRWLTSPKCTTRISN